MPSWNELLAKLRENGETTVDSLRQEYLDKLHKYRKRNVIAYYSGWLQKGAVNVGVEINDQDKNAFMATMYQLDRNLGLDLILHTPGGQVSTTESLGNYLRNMFDNFDIEVFIPQIAMSAGTMIACTSKVVHMGKQSSIGPIDPQIDLLSARNIIRGFKKAADMVKENPSAAHLWQPIMAKYDLTTLVGCEESIFWVEEMVHEWLKTGMFSEDPDGEEKAKQATANLLHQKTSKPHDKSSRPHDRQLSSVSARKAGLKVKDLEDDNELQDLVLTVHHAYMITFSQTPAVKIVENHKGVAMITQQQPSSSG